MTQGEYQIRVKGKLDSNWSEWFDGWTITTFGDGATVLSKQDTDQAALHGALIKIRNLNLPLISVSCIDKNGKESLMYLTSEQLQDLMSDIVQGLWKLDVTHEVA